MKRTIYSHMTAFLPITAKFFLKIKIKNAKRRNFLLPPFPQMW